MPWNILRNNTECTSVSKCLLNMVFILKVHGLTGITPKAMQVFYLLIIMHKDGAVGVGRCFYVFGDDSDSL